MVGIQNWIDEWIKDMEWEFQKDFPISMNIFTDKTKKELESRIGGEVRQDVDKDTERHGTQKELYAEAGFDTASMIHEAEKLVGISTQVISEKTGS